MATKGAILRFGVRQFGKLGLYWPLVDMMARAIVEIDADGSTRPATSARPEGDKRRTLLALSPDRFRGDLRVLAGTGAYRVLMVPFEWQTRLIFTFRPTSTPALNFYDPPASSPAARHKTVLHQYLRGFLASLYRRLGVDAVLSAGVHYRRDYDWGAASAQIGVPFVILHRECFNASPGARRENLERWRAMGRFAGSLIIVHNDVVKQGLLESGFAREQEVAALGCLRMDRFVARVRAAAAPETDRKRAVFYSFPHGSGILDLIWSDGKRTGFEQLFNRSHAAFAEFARAHPDTDCVLALKWGGNWHDKARAAFQAGGIDPAGIPNLRILDEPDVQALSFSADVICGFNSTTLLEAGIIGKPIVIPVFAEADDPHWGDFVKLRDAFDAFDIATSPEQLKTRLSARLTDPHVDADRLARRRALFETWVSSLDGDATDKYARAISAQIDAAMPQRTAAA